VHFKWKDKELVLRARGLDLTHPYFVSITDIVFPEGKKIIIDPSEDEVRRTFGKADHLMIPFQTVNLIEEYKEGEPEQGAVVRDFKLIDETDEPPEEDDAAEETEPPDDTDV
jgi:hypothetical protein